MSVRPVGNPRAAPRKHATNVKRWRDGQTALRWCTAGMTEAAASSAASTAHLHLPKLRTGLERHFRETQDSRLFLGSKLDERGRKPQLVELGQLSGRVPAMHAPCIASCRTGQAVWSSSSLAGP